MQPYGGRYWNVVLVLGVVAGCGGGIKTYPVDGKVVFKDGTPATELGGRMVTFQPVEGAGLPQGEIQADATFTVRTFAPGDGAASGKYRVSVGPQPGVLPTDRKQPPAVIAKKYLDPKTSGLEVIVEAKRNQITLTFERAKK